MHIFSQIKIHFFSLVVLCFLVLLFIPAKTEALCLFGTTCDTTTSVSYCNSDDPNSPNYCSIDRGTQVVKDNINDIETERKFSVYVQDIIAYLLLFLGIVGVIYIIYAGFQVLTAGGSEDNVKKSKATILHVVIGLLLIFLAYSIVKLIIGDKGILNNAFVVPSLIETTHAYTEYDLNTFDNYKKDIELLSSTLDREYQVNNKITAKTLATLGSLVKSSMDTFPSSNDIVFNTNIANSLITAIEVVKKTPDSDTAITNLAKGLNDYLTKVKIGRIRGKIIASPETGNAPLTVTLRASEVIDPSGVTIPKAGYIWWIRSAGGGRTILGTGPSISYVFPEERTYTVFLNILSSSRNKNGKTDVLPFDSSVNIYVLPKLANISLAINGIYVSNLDKIKFTPAQGKQGLLIDPTASISAAGTRFISTRFDFGNGNIAQYNSSPALERQIYSNEGIYKLKMEVVTNENKKIIKDLEIEIRDPISSIKADKIIGFPRDEFRFSASNSAAMQNLGYTWQIIDESEKNIFTSSLQNISYKFLRTGKYTVKLKTRASNGKEDNDTLSIAIEGHDPIATFESKTINSEGPNTHLFDATKSYDPDNLDASNLGYAWIIDGVRTDLSNPVRNGAIGRYTFDTIGTHRVTLEVSNKEGKTISFNKDIVIDSLLSIKLITSPKIAQIGLPVSFIADSKEAQTFEWQFGDGETDTSTSGRVTHVYKKAGTYSVNVTVRGRNSDSNSISRKVYITDSTNPLAIITLKRDGEDIIPESDVCDGQEAFVIDRAKATTMSAENSVNIDGTNQGISYTWKYGNRSSSQKDFSYKFDELGCFPITLTVRSQKTGMQDTVRAYVKIENLAPKLSSLSVIADKLDVDPVTVTVTANNAIDDDGVITSYIWYYYTEEDPEPQDFRITRSPKTVFVLPRIGARYYFAVILEDSNGLKINSADTNTEKYSLTITADNINTPIISLKSSSTTVGVGQNIDFTVTAKNILGTNIADKSEYKWDYNGDGFYEETTSVPNVSHVYDKPGNFNFKVKVTHKGISNTKYQSILVKNDIQPSLEYIAIGKKFIFLNTTKGLYSQSKWAVADVISTNGDSFIYDFADEVISGDVALQVTDGTVTKKTSATPRKDLVNIMKVKKSSEKLIYFSYPSSEGDIINIQNSTDKLFLYLGESKGPITKYGIDIDTSIDSNLNGDPSDDIDNKGTDSSINGSVFVLKSSDISAKERTVRLSLYDSNNTVLATKDIKILYDFNAGVATETLSGSTMPELPKDISETDKANLEKLKELIRGTKEQDRLKMMQYFSALQENWFDAREKTKTIIDFQAYIENTSALDAKTKDGFYSLLDGFLLADTEVKDDIALATKVLKSLVPKTNTSYAQIIKNIDDIISHPTNIALNKELGTFILNAIKDDENIETKDKNIIKSQLQTIIYGGQNNIPSTVIPPEVVASGSSSILNFLLGFGKALFYILLVFLGIIISAFLYFKILNKDGNLGFQDFIIDKMAGKKATPKTDIVKPVISEIVVPKKDIKSSDIQTNITPVDEVKNITNISEKQIFTESIEQPLSINEPIIPDWLKASTTIASHTEDISLVQNEVNNKDLITQEIPTESTSPSLPDWLKGSDFKDIAPIDGIADPIIGELPPVDSNDQEQIFSTNIEPIADAAISDLPPWMKGVNQESLKGEIEEEMKSTSDIVKESGTSSYEDIPDWLKDTALVTTDVVIENPETLTKESIDTVTSSEDASNINSYVGHEKQFEKFTGLEVGKAEVINEQKESSQVPGKKKKTSPVIVEKSPVSNTTDDLPDWLK